MKRIAERWKAYRKNARAIRQLYDNRLKRVENLPQKDRAERQFYDAIAEPYLENFDADRFLYDADEDMPRSHLFLYSHLDNLDGKRILDCCCGYGFTSVRCAKRGGQVTGIDISPGMLKLAGKNIDLNGVSDQVDLRLMSVHDMDFPDKSFDYAVGLGALHHLNLDLAGKEISRVLKDGGMAIFLEPRIPFKWLFSLRSLFPAKCMESPGGGGMRDADIRQFASFFSSHRVDYFWFLMKLARLPLAGRLAPFFDASDVHLARSVPFLKYLYWAFVLRFFK